MRAVRCGCVAVWAATRSMVARVYLRLARLVRRTMGWLTVATTCSDACRARRDGRRRRRYALRVRWPAALLLVLIAAPPAAHAQPARWRGTGVVVAVLPAPSSRHATRQIGRASCRERGERAVAVG